MIETFFFIYCMSDIRLSLLEKNKFDYPKWTKCKKNKMFLFYRYISYVDSILKIFILF